MKYSRETRQTKPCYSLICRGRPVKILCHLSVPFLNKQHSLRGCTSATNVNMSPSDRLEIRVIIEFCHDLGKTPTQTLKMIEQTRREHLVSKALVFKRHRRFSVAQDSLEEQEGRASKKETVWPDDSDVNA